MAGLNIDAVATAGTSGTATVNGQVAPSTGPTAVLSSFSVYSDASNQLFLKSPQVLVDGKLKTLNDVSVSAGYTHYCNVTDQGAVSISASPSGKYSVPVCKIGTDGTVLQYHAGTLSVGGGGGGGGIKFVGTDGSSNWSGDVTSSATYTFATGGDSNVVVKVSGTNTNATIAIDVYYK